jgi:uncharacterized membrane protein
MTGAEALVLQSELLPSGFSLPPLPYLAGLVMGAVIVGVLLVVLRLEVTSNDVLALGVWMAIGATLHATHQLGAFPEWAAPLFGAPAVYLTTFIVTGLLWMGISIGAAAEVFSSTGRLLGSIGLLVWIVLLLFYLVSAPVVRPFWPTAGLFATVIVGTAGFIGLALVYTDAVAATGKVGAFVVFSHTLDGVSTAIGVDVLCVDNGPLTQAAIRSCEQTPLPRLIMGVAIDINAQLPVYLGVGWLFVLTKVLLAAIIVAVFADYVEEVPSRGNVAMAALAAVGLGPGVFNLLVFLVTEAATAPA